MSLNKLERRKLFCKFCEIELKKSFIYKTNKSFRKWKTEVEKDDLVKIFAKMQLK